MDLHFRLNLKKLCVMNLNKKIESKNPETIRKMFDGIASTYDLLNRLMSFGLDIKWRKRAVDLLKNKKNGVFLDIAAGSGDVSIELLRLEPKMIIASDFSNKMLLECKNKIHNLQSGKFIHCAGVDALYLPFRANTFDATLVAFGIRNFADRLLALKEMHRVLRDSGISIILELTEPRSPFISCLYKFHSKVLLPFMGKIISKHNSAYSYLPESIETFPNQHDFLKLMDDAGFSNSRFYILSFGVVTIFVGEKSNSSK